MVGAGALGGLVLGALAALGLLEAGTALGLAAIGVVGAAVAAVAVMVRRLGRRVNRLSRELEGRMGEGVRAVEEHQARTGASFEEVTAELARLRDETLSKLSGDVIRTVNTQGRNGYEQQVEGSVEDAAQPWYDLKAVADLKEIGLVFVDGPPGATSPQARYPAVPALLPHCVPDVVIVLDDTVRRAERDLSDRWLAAYPELSCRPEPLEKGARVFTRNAL